METGNLVPDDLLVALVRERIGEPDCDRGFILDGFPRTLPQAEGLEEMSGDPRAWVVFNFEVPREELLRRLSGRRWCPTCQATYHVQNDPPKKPGVCDACGTALVQREDDQESVVAQRLREYDERTFPLIEYYRTRARMVPIDGYRPMDVVFAELLEAVGGAGVSVQKSWSELQTMHRACSIVVETLDVLEAAAVPGVTTKELDRIAREQIEKAGAQPAFLGYRGYPATLCVSVNEEVVHGIPGPRKLHEGDIVGLDLGCIVDGFFGDAARTVAVGQAGEGAQRLMKVTREALLAGHRGVPPRQARGRHRPRGADPRRGPRLLGGAGVRRPRHRHEPARGAAGPELRPAGTARAAGARHVPGHRADGERGGRRRSRCWTTAGPR